MNEIYPSIDKRDQKAHSAQLKVAIVFTLYIKKWTKVITTNKRNGVQSLFQMVHHNTKKNKKIKQNTNIFLKVIAEYTRIMMHPSIKVE